MSLNITVITDTHYYSPETGTNGKAYENALMRSQKLLGGSRELLQAAFNKITEDKSSNIVLVAGDVINDGEEAAHIEFREMLRELKATEKSFLHQRKIATATAIIPATIKIVVKFSSNHNFIEYTALKPVNINAKNAIPTADNGTIIV